MKSCETAKESNWRENKDVPRSAIPTGIYSFAIIGNADALTVTTSPSAPASKEPSRICTPERPNADPMSKPEPSNAGSEPIPGVPNAWTPSNELGLLFGLFSNFADGEVQLRDCNDSQTKNIVETAAKAVRTILSEFETVENTELIPEGWDSIQRWQPSSTIKA